jgi:diguanylate cyclase (GGDEF)-like protein
VTRQSGNRLAGVAVASVLFLVLVRLQPGGPKTARAIDDLGQLLAAAIATLAAGRRARRSGHGAGRSWLLLAIGTGSWTAGEAAWSYYELLAGQQTPFPSIADAGFLLFPLLAAAALLVWPSANLGAAARGRALLDGILVSGALFIITWVTALGSAADTSATGWLGYLVSLAYPTTDLVLLTLTILIVTHSRHDDRSGLTILAAGLVSLCVADSAFAYLTATSRYATGNPVDAGWFCGFLLLALSAHTAHDRATDERQRRSVQRAALESTPQALLPYLPAGLGLAVAIITELHRGDDRVSLLAAALVITALLIRQLLAVLDNRRLVEQLVRAQLELQHRAFHDPLTGLANRALFTDRLRHGLELHRRDHRPLGLLFCDLDGFKAVNDSLGHDAGDDLLKTVAERLRTTTRTADTVARLGGDEFAVLLEGSGDAARVATRLLQALTEPAAIGRHHVPLSASIGVTELHAGDPTPDPALLLQHADQAMYAAKRAGKGTAVLWTNTLAQHENLPT